MLVKFLGQSEPVFTFLLSWFNDFEIQFILPNRDYPVITSFLHIPCRYTCCDITDAVFCGIMCLYCCLPSLQKYKEYEKDVAIEEIDGLQLVKKLAKNMEEMFHKKSEAVRVSVSGFCSALSQDTKAVSGRWH